MTSKKICRGYPKRGNCDKPVRSYGWGDALWCKEHDEMRLDNIGKSLDRMIAKFDEDKS